MPSLIVTVFAETSAFAAVTTAIRARFADAGLPPFALRSTKSVLNRHLKAAAREALGYGLALEEQALAEFTAGRR